MPERKYTIESVGPRIDQFLRLIRDRMELELAWKFSDDEAPHPEIENPDVTVRFSGHDVDMLLENRAELLLALEHLTMEMLRLPHEDHTRLCFDANDHRILRIAELHSSALTAAERVRATHRPFRFNPMTSRERRIIQLALRDQKDLRSESEGGEPRRNVVIYPADMPSAAQPGPPPPRGAHNRRRR